ncbi:MAG: hypothetical protein ACREKS_06770 [Candidatus Rokuibacteriota bacterium]
MAESALPVIDIGPYRAGNPAGTKRVADAVAAACERIMLAKLERRETRPAPAV